jgi:hypothetical protein
MADSENTTSLSGVSRRALISGVAAAPLVVIDSARSSTADLAGDPVLPLWRDWRRAYRAEAAWCHEWQRIETLLYRTVGFPRVLVPRADGAKPRWATTVADIDAALEGLPEADALRAGLHAALAEREARWRTAAQAAGFDEAEARETAAWTMRRKAAEAIFAQASGALVGVAAKLTVILATGQSRPNDPEFPWPEIRSALSDLQRIGGSPDEMLAV